MAAGVFLLGHVQRFQGLVDVIGIIEDQLAVGIVCSHGFEQRLGFKFCKSFPGVIRASGQFQRFSQVIQVLGVGRSVKASLKKIHSLVVTFLLDANLGQISQCVVIAGKQGERLLQQFLCFIRLT